MDDHTFEHHIAKLLSRNGYTNVVIQGGRSGQGVGIIPLTATDCASSPGARGLRPTAPLPTRTSRGWPGWRKLFTTRTLCGDVPFTSEALSIAAQTVITAVHRGTLDKWSAGEPLKILE